nr:hypothetical protein [Armatimonas sp.]
MSTITLTVRPSVAARLKKDPTARAKATELLDREFEAEDARERQRAFALKQAEADKALFALWDEEDATDDEDELRRRDEEDLELRRALNNNRKATGERIPYPELEHIPELESEGNAP